MKDYLSKPEINFLLSILIPLLALAVSWGILSSRVDQLCKDLDEMKATVKGQQSINTDIQVRLAEIQKDVLYIKVSLDKREM